MWKWATQRNRANGLKIIPVTANILKKCMLDS